MRKVWLGKLGQGKSYAMTCELLNELNRGTIVYTNYRIFWNGKTVNKFNWKTWKWEKISYPASNLRPVAGLSIKKILQHVENGTKQRHNILALDEGYLYFDSYQGTRMSLDVRKFILHSRKRHIDIWYTAQRLMSIATTMREMTDYFYKCRSLNLLFFRIFWVTMHDLEDKKDGGLSDRIGFPSFYLSNPIVYKSYDTDEIIDEGEM